MVSINVFAFIKEDMKINKILMSLYILFDDYTYLTPGAAI